MTYFFYGTKVQWIAYKDSASGIAQVQVDRDAPTFVDLYSPVPVLQAVVFSRENLPSGFHLLTIDVTNTRNEASAGTKVWIDALEDDTPWTTYTNEILQI